MPKYLALIAVAIGAVAHDIRSQIKLYRAAQDFLESSKIYEENEIANHARITYLISLLEKHGIEPTEFDLIALNYHED